MEGRMAGNAHRGAMACLNDAGFRDTLRNHNTDRAYVSRELDRIGIDFSHDDKNKTIRNHILDIIATSDWTDLSNTLEGLCFDADGELHPLMG
jgi:hypothetical protein